MQNVVQLFSSENPSALIDRAELTAVVELLSRIVPKQTPAPILNHLRFSSEPGGIAITANNLDIQVETSIIADVDARFSAALPAAAMTKILKKGATTETVILELLPPVNEGEEAGPGRCMVQLGASSFTVDILSTDDLPGSIKHGDDDKVHRFSMASAVLWNAIDGTIDAVSTEETRPYLHGIFMHSVNGRLRFTATDGHRLYIQDTNVQSGKVDIAGIIPTDAARFVAALLDGYASADPVQIELSQSVAVFIFRDVAVTLKLNDGTFPDYQRVIPAAPDKAATVLGKALYGAIVSLVDCTGAKTARFKFSASKLIITANGPAGDGETELECAFEGDDFEITFSAKNLQSIIDGASPDGKNITFKMTDAVSPAVVTGSVGGWSGVLMPMAG